MSDRRMQGPSPLSGLRSKVGLSPIIALFIVMLMGLPFAMIYAVERQVRTESLDNARAISELMLQVRRYYNLNIVNRLQQGDHPVTVTENYEGLRGAIPLPATMSIEITALLNKNIPDSPFDFNFSSDYPFKGRNRPALDGFQREALEIFRKEPERKEYWRQDRSASGAATLRLAIPVTMQPVCVSCHNSHPESTFKSWRAGDVRGIQDVTVRHAISEGRVDNFLMLGGYLAAFLVVMLLAINEYRRSNLRLRALTEQQARDRDVLERQRGQLELQMNELVTKTTVLDKAPFGVIVADPHQPDWPVVYVNEAFTRITGYSSAEIIGRNCRVLQGPETDASAVGRIQAALQEKRHLEVDLINYRRDGQPFHNRLQLFPCFNAAGELVSYVATAVDATDLKMAQAQREQFASELQESQKLHYLSLAIAGIAHDINTPIGVALTASTHIASQAEQLRAAASGGLSSEASGRLATTLEKSSNLITRNLTKAADLVRSFKQTTLDANRIEWRRIALGPFLDSLLLSISPLMKRARCEVLLDCPPQLEMNTEPGYLGQVLTNLVVNASIHAFDETSDRRIHIRAQADGDEVVIEVCDTGKGMTAETLAQAFQPFFTTRRGSGGSGLGLFSSRRVVEQILGGKISLASQLGQGTTFTIRLPSRMRASAP